MPVDIEYGCDFGGSNQVGWLAEYEANVRELEREPLGKPASKEVSRLFMTDSVDEEQGWRDAWYEYADFESNTEEAEYGFIRDF